MKLNQNKGFTLLEIIIVIIIVGVLASLALPRFFNTVEYSRSTEAFASMAALRGSMERCYLQSGNMASCTNVSTLDVEDPQNSPNNHFTYSLAQSASNAYSIVASRNTRDNGSTTSTITMTTTSTGITRSGATAFVGVK